MFPAFVLNAHFANAAFYFMKYYLESVVLCTAHE